MLAFLDMSSILWTNLLVGKDSEGIVASHNDKLITVNSAEYGYDNTVNSILLTLSKWKIAPMNVVMVFEGRDSKKRRCNFYPEYKGNRDGAKCNEMYEEFNKLKDKVKIAFLDLGAIAVTQDYVEGDDTLAYLAKHSEDDCLIVTNDNDLVVLNGTNDYGAKCIVSIRGESGVNKYGQFDFKLVTLYKSLVGDPSDNIKGVQGFGAAAFNKLLETHKQDGLYKILSAIENGEHNLVATLAKETECKGLQKVSDNWSDAIRSHKLVSLHPEWINTPTQPLKWSVGMVKKCNDARFKFQQAQVRHITSDTFQKAYDFMESKIYETPYFTMDFETTTTVESDDWLEYRDKSGVDVLASTIVSMSITFGANIQYGYYISINHKDTKNCTLDQLASLLELVPTHKHFIAHNAAGFELPVAYNAFKDRWASNGWRGFMPNMLDSRIAATFENENRASQGLKQLSKGLLGYEQGTYEEVTTKVGRVGELVGGLLKKAYEEDGIAYEVRQYKMDELCGDDVVEYGVDDSYTAGALFNYFRLVMKLEHTYDAFIRLEQKPMYLSALAYVRGLDVDIPRLKELESNDRETSDKCLAVINEYLISNGWEGSTVPVFTELSTAKIKEIVYIVLGIELKTQVRSVDKLAKLIYELDHDDADILASAIQSLNLDLINQMVKSRYKCTPMFNVGSPKQLTHLMYDVMKLPVRLRNKVTNVMREKGIKQGNPRTDDEAIEIAIKFKDVDGQDAETLKSILNLKSCNTRNALYWSAYPKMLHWKTRKIHPEIKQSSTNTRRWTCSTPNIQQMESSSNGVRSVIRDSGRIITSLDQSSQEVRLMAELSKDEGLLSCYIGDNLKDTHSLVAHRIAKVTYEEFMQMRNSEDKQVSDNASSIRKVAKAVFFGFLFGAAAPKLAETLGITEHEAQGYIDAINNAFPKIRAYQEESSEMAEKLGYVEILGGTRRHLAELVYSPDKWEASKALRQAGNARIQGAAANQIKTVMSDIWDSDLIETTSFKWLFCVHDEVVISTKKEDTVEVVKRVHEFMVKPFMSVVPSESSIGLGKNFGQLLEQPEGEFSKGKFNKDLLHLAVDKVTLTK